MLSFKNLIKFKKLTSISQRFLFYNIISIISFTFLYYFSELFVFYVPLAQTLNLGKIHKLSSLSDYFTFSITNQSTIGHYSIKDSRDGSSNVIFSLLNNLQMISVIAIWGLVLH